MLQGEHSVILLTFIKMPYVIKIFVLSIFSGRFTHILHKFYIGFTQVLPYYTGFTVCETPPLKGHAEVSRGTRCQSFDLSFPLYL